MSPTNSICAAFYETPRSASSALFQNTEITSRYKDHVKPEMSQAIRLARIISEVYGE